MDTELKVRSAARAAWKTFFVSWGLVAFTYFAYLAMNAGWLDWLIDAGVYGPVGREQLAMVTFYYIGAMKLIGLCFLLGAIFLTFWRRGLARAGKAEK